jgi:hypothetical protein
MFVIGKRKHLDRIALEGLGIDVRERVAGEVHCLQLGLFQEGFLVDVVDVVPGRIELYKRS